MSQDGSNANKSAITVALIATRATIVAALVAAAAVLPSRGGGSSSTNLAAVTTSSQRVTSPSSSSPTPAPSTTGSASPNESPPCATGSLTLVGSTAFMPIAQDAAEAYMQDCLSVGVRVTITVNNGGNAYSGDSAFGLKKVQDAVNSGSSNAGSMIAMYDGTSTGTKGLRAYAMGFVIFSVVAYAGLFPGSNIATGDLVTIFVKHGDKGVVAVGRRAGSGSRKAFIMTVLGFNPPPPDKGSCPAPTGSAVSRTSCTAGSTDDLLMFVNGTPNAIGYADTYGPFPGYRDVSVLSIDGVPPTLANVSNGLYKFWAVEHLYAYVSPTALATDFLAFLPDYLKTHPQQDFIACSDASNTLESYCQPAILPPLGPTSSTSPGRTSSTSRGSTSSTSPPPTPVNILYIILAILIIAVVILAIYWIRRLWVSTHGGNG